MRPSSWLIVTSALASAVAGSPLGIGAQPAREHDLLPSRVALADHDPPSGARLADVSTCEPCHADVVEAWRTSAHAFASFNNPLYRVSVDRFRSAVSARASRHCGGCHDPSLLADGAMEGPIDHDDDRAHAGVSCLVCHGITDAKPDGNGSYTLTGAPVPMPRRGDPESVRRHKARLAPDVLRTAAHCGSCHRAFLDASTGNEGFFAGADDLGPWQRSAYATSLAERVDEPVAPMACKDCHMPRERVILGDAAAKEGTVASHRFLGGHTHLAAMRGDGDALARAEGMLKGAASIAVAAITRPDGSLVAPGDPSDLRGELRLSLVVKNQRAGHPFPGGVRDAQDTWIALSVEDARGAIVAEAGMDHEGGADPTAHELAAIVADARGVRLVTREVERFRAVVADHTVGPRAARAIAFTIEVPDDAVMPLRATARLLHRSRTEALAALACDDQRTARGLAFAARSGLDACAPQPITIIAEDRAIFGERGEGPSASAWLDYAEGLLYAVQERGDEARPALDRARSLVGTGIDRARSHFLLGVLEGKQGRVEEALAALDRAAIDAPGHPAIARARAESFAQVWRWADAVPHFTEAAHGSPRDDRGWAALAVALGSRGGDPAAELAAAQRALALSPRDTDALRTRALALQALGVSAGDAIRRYDEHRPPDFVPRVRALCGASSASCALERKPVHEHATRRPSAR